MLTPVVRCFNIIMVTDFQLYILSNKILSVCILIWGKKSAPWDEMVNSLGACIAESTPRVSHITKNISLKTSSEGNRILCLPWASTLSRALLTHWWVSCKSTSAFWLRCGYWPCKGFDFQAVSITFFPFSLAIFFNFQAKRFHVLHLPIRFSFKI